MSRSRRTVPSRVEVEVRGKRVKHDMKRRTARLQRKTAREYLNSICHGCGLNLDHCMCNEGSEYASNHRS